MFNRSRQTIATEARPNSNFVANNPGTSGNAGTAATAPVIRKAITDEMLLKAWTSFALRLPENEHALSDRMKIMVPKIAGEDSFTISVDNQMAAELFEKEAKRICKGMENDLEGHCMRMSVTVNKVIVERHTSDKGKQFEILKGKNPLIEKLRRELDLELAR